VGFGKSVVLENKSGNVSETRKDRGQESSAKLTNQRVSYAFASSPLSFHPVIFCLLPSTSIVILVFYLFSTGISEQHV